MIKEQGLYFVGDVYIDKTSEDGSVQNIHHKNLVVSAGKAFMCERATSNATVVMSHMAVGTGNTSTDIGDTTLATELSRVALTVNGGTPSANTITYTGEFPAGTGTGAWEEAGVFNDVTAGDMMARTVFPTVNKQASDAITITWVISVV